MNALLPDRKIRSATADDFSELTKIGYKISIADQLAADFVNTHFPNLDLLQWAKDIDMLFDNFAVPPLAKAIEMSISSSVAKIEIVFCDKLFTHPEDGTVLCRELTNVNGAIHVEHKLFRIPTKQRGQQLSKKLFSSSLQQYINMEISTIGVTTGLSHGGFVWAEYGFKAVDKNDMEKILNKAKTMLRGTDFEVVKKVFDKYYGAAGSQDRFPIAQWSGMEFMEDVLMGTSWKGIIDFKNTEQITNFIKKCAFRI